MEKVEKVADKFEAYWVLFSKGILFRLIISQKIQLKIVNLSILLPSGIQQNERK